MMDKFFFVKEPAWKIFLIAIGPMLLVMLIAIIYVNLFIMIIPVLFREVFELVWIYGVCNYIAKAYSSHINVPIRRLNVSVIILIICMVLYVSDILPIKILQVLSMITFGLNIYCIYFIARLLVMVEKERKVTINDYFLTAVFTYFWFFGIWALQPRINRIYSINS